jgi:hypothetical protein
MVQEADRLNRVITDLLYLANPRKPKLERIDLEAVITELETLLAIDLQAAKADLEVSLEVRRMVADRDLVKQAVLNVLMNALQAVESGSGEIRVQSMMKNNEVCIRVQDNGRGMEEEHAKRATEPFFTTRTSGTGLGLAIVQQIVGEHGGRLEIRSQPGRGTIVDLVFPDTKDTA